MSTQSASRALFSALALFLFLIAIILHNNEQSSSQINRSLSHLRRLVGGFSNMDPTTFQSEEIAEIADFSLAELAMSPTFDTVLVVLPEQVESGSVTVKVLEAQRQVVAGMNYKLTLAVLQDNVCVAGLKTSVYKPLPSMEDGLHLTSWGITGGCTEISDLLQAVTELEEANALEVEEEIVEELEETEPDA